jgi:hypothetical protein
MVEVSTLGLVLEPTVIAEVFIPSQGLQTSGLNPLLVLIAGMIDRG